MGDVMFVLVALFPILFWLAIFLLIIYFIVKSVKKSVRAENEGLRQQLADLTRRQKAFAEELKEVKIRLAQVEEASKG